MTRLEKKCVVGSASLHGVLLLVFVFASAFSSSSKKTQTLQVVTIMGAIPTDRLVSTGGSPKGNPTPPPAAAPTPPPPQPESPKPEPPKPEPPKVEPPKPQPVVQKPEPKPLPKVTPKPVEKPLPKADYVAKPQPAPKPKPVPKPAPEPEISTKIVRRTVDTAKQQREIEARKEREKAEEAARVYRQKMQEFERSQKELARRIGGVVDGVGQDLDKGTVVTPLGDGAFAFVHYGSLVRAKFDQAWQEPPSLTDDDGVVQVEIKIARNGRVTSARIIKRSGIPALDKSVQRALDAVKFVAPFPPESKDDERTFTISFSLKAKRMST